MVLGVPKYKIIPHKVFVNWNSEKYDFNSGLKKWVYSLESRDCSYLEIVSENIGDDLEEMVGERSEFY